MKSLALYITNSLGVVECLWELALPDDVQKEPAEKILSGFAEGSYPWPSDSLEEPDGWRGWKMEVREYKVE